ncbi:hypothetical protein JCM9279_000722 [Rhodotorula babjevae]
MATQALEHCLATLLATNDLVPANLPHLVSLLTSQRILQLAEHHEGLHGPLLHRWHLRLVALVAPVNPPQVRQAGFHLAHLSFQASTSLLLDAGKPALTAAVQVLNNPKADPDLFLAALELARLVLAKSTYHPEWARDNVGPQQVQKLVGALVQAASVEFSDVKLPCVAAIVSLLPLFPTALRPLAPSLHNLAVALIAEPTGHAAVVDQGATLFASLYLLAPKGKEGLREAWKTGVEALVGSIDALATHVTAGVFAEDTTFNHTLSPLALPPLVSDAPTNALVRLESLTSVLLAVLRTPTTEKAGLVPLPLGALVELSTRLISLSSLTPVRERTDPALLTSVLALVVPRTQLAGARLAAQLALASGPHLAPHATVVLSALSATLNAYAPREPMRPVLSGAYALVVEQLGSGVDPDEAKKSLARVWRTVLEDIGGVAVEPVVVGAGAGAGAAGAAGKEAGKGGNGRKAKRQKTYEPSESMATRRVSLDEVDMQIAERGLVTLERLLRCPFSHFLPPALQLATARLLLYLSLSPSFSVVHPLASTSTSFYPSTSALSPLDIARQSPSFRRAVLAALVAALATSTCAPSGTHERAAEVFRRASLLSADADARALALEGLALVRTFAHPAVPAQQPNAGLARVRHEAKGGWIGDEREWDRSAREFGIRVEERRADEEGSSDEDESGDEEGANGARNGKGDAGRRRKTPPAAAAPAVVLAPAPAQTAFPATTAFSAPSFASSSAPAQQNGFAAFSAPAFGASTTSGSKVQLDEPASVHAFAPSTGVTVGTLDVETVPASASGAKATRSAAAANKAAADSDEEDDDEDEGMPMIDMGSEEE